MFSKLFFSATVAINVITVSPLFAQTIEVSTLESASIGNVARSSPSAATNYITDVSGRKVRLVGPRFYPDNTRALEFPGRAKDVGSTNRQAHLSQQ